MNVQNLMHHIEDVRNHAILQDQNLVILSETWIPATYWNDTDQQYSLPNFNSNFCNVGNWKGMAGYSDETFKYGDYVVYETYQIMKYSTSFLHKMNNETEVCIISL